MKLLLCLALLTIAEVRTEYDYLAENMMNCSTEFPKLPEDQQWKVGQHYKECVPMHPDNLFCTKLCQLRRGIGWLFCWDTNKCQFQTGAIEVEFPRKTNTDDGLGPGVNATRDTFTPGPVFLEIENLKQRVTTRMSACFSKEPLIAPKGIRDIDEDCPLLTPENTEQINKFMNCFEESWAQC